MNGRRIAGQAMTTERARRILRALGWRPVDLERQMNRTTGTKFRSGDIWKWLHGHRGIPLAVAVFLRMSVRVAVLRRQLDRARSRRA
jgi:hypothetical protein